MDAKVYNQKGEEAGKMKLPDKVFGSPWNADLVHQVVVSMQSNARIPWAHVKDRGEVSGGGKKPWRQKGTGRARHGSIRSPIWVGGGVTHGPRKEKNYKKVLTRSMKKGALYAALSAKARDKEIFVLEDVKFEKRKTKEANNLILSLSKIAGLEKLKTKKKNRALVLTGKNSEDLKKAFGNLTGVMVEEIKNLNPLSVLTYKFIIFTKSSLSALEK